MDQLVLCFNDIPLILIIFQSMLFCAFLLGVNVGLTRSNILLAFFILAIGVDALDIFLYWSQAIKQYLHGYVAIFYCLKFGVYLGGPMLFLYVKSIVSPNFRLGTKDLIHIIPLLIFPILMLALYLSQSSNQRVEGIAHYGELFKNPFFQAHLWMRHILYVFYSIASFRVLAQHKEQLKQNFSNIENIDMLWLKMLVTGFLAIWAWIFLGYLLTIINSTQKISDYIGIISNFFNFIFLNVLVLYSIAHAKPTKKTAPVLEKAELKEIEKLDVSTIESLHKAMVVDELFLDPELTLEELSEKIHVSPRRVSTAINQYHQQNFFDFVNSYRVKKSAALLASSPRGVSLLEVMADAGFNSKSTFYRSFKKHMGTTPLEYCDQLLNSSNE